MLVERGDCVDLYGGGEHNNVQGEADEAENHSAEHADCVHLYPSEDSHEEEDEASDGEAGAATLGGGIVGREGVDDAVNAEVGHSSLRDGWERANSLKFS